MIRKSLDLPMKVAQAFVKDMRAFQAEPNPVKRRAFAEQQLDALQPFLGPRDKKLRLRDVITLFEEMREQR